MRNIELHKIRSDALKKTRTFFYERDFLEIQTPSLVPSGALEPYLDCFDVDCLGEAFQLPTSPELHLKRALEDGCERVFEIKTSFRNEAVSEIHHPEFQMLEWYRQSESLESLIDDVVGLVTLLTPVDSGEKFEINRFRVADLFQEFLGFNLKPETSSSELKELCAHHKIVIRGDESWNDLFHLLYLEKIEKKFGEFQFLIIEDYPPKLSALAKISDNGWAKRFEVFINGIEIANAYDELMNAEELLNRFHEWNGERQALGKKPHNEDSDFFRMYESGSKPAVGIALGFDRLLMILFGKQKLSEIVPESFNHFKS